MKNQIKTSRVMLVYAPFEPSGYLKIYPSLPILASALDEGGFRSNQMDLNNDFLHWYLKSDHLNQKVNAAGKSTSRLEKKLKISRDEYALYYEGKKLALLGGLINRNRRYKDECIAIEILINTIHREIGLPVDYKTAVLKDGCHKLIKIFFREWLASLDVTKPLFVGISLAVPRQVIPATIMARMFAKKWQGVPIILGGPILSLINQEFLKNILRLSMADGAVIGEGEESIVEIANQLSSLSWRPEKIANFVFLNSGKLIKSKTKPVFSLDCYPPPKYDSSKIAKWKPASLDVLVGRRCYWGRCAFCNFQSLSQRRQMRDPSVVVRDIEALILKHRLTSYQLICDSIEPEYIRKFCKLIIKKGIHIEWNCFIKADANYSEKDFFLMRKAGCSHVAVGLESLDDKALKRMNKGYTRSEATLFLKRLYNSGIWVRTDVIVDFPGTSFDSAKAQHKILTNLLTRAAAKKDALYVVAVYRLSIFGSAPLGRHMEKYGLKPARSARLSDFSPLTGLPFKDPSGMNSRQIAHISDLYRRLNEKLENIRINNFDKSKNEFQLSNSSLMWNQRCTEIKNFYFEGDNSNKYFTRLKRPLMAAYNCTSNNFTIGYDPEIIAEAQKCLPCTAKTLESNLIKKFEFSTEETLVAIRELWSNGLICPHQGR